MTGTDPQLYLRAADSMLSGADAFGAGAIADGWWPKAGACLIRLALEAGIDRYWDTKIPAVTACHRWRVKLLMLRRYANVDIARRSTFTWTELSRIAHYRGHDPAPSAVELRRLHTVVAALVVDLAQAA